MKIYTFAVLISIIISNSLFADERHSIIDKETNMKINYITNSPSLNTMAYPTCKTWCKDSKWIFFESTRPRPDGTQNNLERQILKTNIETGEMVHLATLEVEDIAKYGTAQFGGSSQYHFDYAPDANILIYYDIRGHNLYLMNVETGKTNRILHESEGTIGDPPAITHDGSRVVYYASYRSQGNRFFSDFMSAIFAIDIDVETLEPIGEPKIITAYPARKHVQNDKQFTTQVNHSQINPINKDHICYAHQYYPYDGVHADGTPALSRLWENINGADVPIAICEPRIWKTHEVIGPFGKDIYFIERFNLVSINFETRERTLIYENKEGWNPLHITISPDEKWIAADTYDDKADEKGLFVSNIMLIERETGKAKYLCKDLRRHNHPAHAHPNFSPDGKKLVFVSSETTSSCQIAYIDISDVIENWDKD